jgi:glutathione S-transferase
MEALTLYVDSFYISPYAASAFVALEEKRLPYQLAEVSLPDKAQLAAGYAARTRRVPALHHGDYWLAESQAIAEYLADVFPTPAHPALFPPDFRARGICREVMSWLRSDLMPIREERATHTIWFAHTDVPLSAAGRVAADRLIAYADRLIGNGKTTVFDAWCIADCDLSIMLQRLNLNGERLPAKLARYAEANWERPSINKWNQLPRRAYVPY